MSTLTTLLQQDPNLRQIEINAAGAKRFQEKRKLPVTEGDTFLLLDKIVRGEDILYELAYLEINCLEVNTDRDYWNIPGNKERK